MPGGATESTGLLSGLKKQHGMYYWWTVQASGTYKFAVTYALRVAVWTTLMSVVPLAFAKGRALFSEWGFNVAYIVCNFLFIIGADVGSTMSNSLLGLIGNFYASLMLYALNGFFPGGYTGDNALAFWVGLSASIIFIVVFLFLNVNASIQFFALYGYIPFMMMYLNPNASNGVSKAFELNHKGAAVNAVILYLIGAVFAILCSLLPYPVTARQKVINQVTTALEETHNLFRQILDYYSGASANMEVYELMSNVEAIRTTLNDCSSSLGASWWECFGIGSRGVSRQMTKQFIEELQGIVRQLDPLIAAIGREGFENTHIRVAESVRNELHSLVNKSQALFSFLYDTSKDGVLNSKERAGLESDLRELEQSMQALEAKFARTCSDVSRDPVTLTLTGEHYFVTATLKVAHHVKKRASGMLAGDHPPGVPIYAAFWGDLKNTFDPSVLSSKDHLWWVLRNALSLGLCFSLGYVGYSQGCDKPGRSCFIRPYNASLATLVIVLLSKFVGSTFTAAIGRLTAVVLANVTGQLGYVLVGWCTPFGRFMTAVLVFVIVSPNMYMAYTSGTNAALGVRLAAIGAMSLLTPCSDDYITHAQYADQYHAISDIVVAAFIIMAVDMTLGGKPASTLAKEGMIKAIEDYQKIFKDFQKPNPPSGKELADRLDKVHSAIDNVSSLCVDAAKEPRFWRMPWRPKLFEELTRGYSHLCALLHLLIVVTSSDHFGAESTEMNKVLKITREWPTILSEVDSRLGFTVDVSLHILHTDRPSELTGLAKLLSHTQESLAVEPFIKELNSSGQLKVDSSRLTGLVSGSSIVVETLVSIMKHLKKLQEQVILSKTS